jgi:ADP-ribosyl-[dinitrogen reductase] hydrolase
MKRGKNTMSDDGNRIAGGLMGLLIGDALGVPYEFHPPEAIPPPDEIEFNPPLGFRRAHFGVRPGTWSDDGAQALVLLESLIRCNTLNLDDFGSGLVRWRNEGFCAVGGSVFDIGSQTSTAINRLASGVPADRTGPDAEDKNGNGSLMRVLPLALWHVGSDAELAFLAMRQSLPTHGHIHSQLACAFYCLWVRALMQGGGDAWHDAEDRLRTIALQAAVASDEIDEVLAPENAQSAYGSGYVLDTLWSARSVFESTQSYEECVRSAIALGHDTDTTAAVAGGIAGVKYGLPGIPERWRNELRGEPIYRPLLDALLVSKL